MYEEEVVLDEVVFELLYWQRAIGHLLDEGVLGVRAPCWQYVWTLQDVVDKVVTIIVL